MRIFKTKWFSRFASRESIDDTKLVEAVQNMENGLVDADYGGGMIKQRISRESEGKSGGYRSIIAFKSETRSIFFFAFPKSEKDNLTKAEVREYKKRLRYILNLLRHRLPWPLRKKNSQR